ncbi:hypothetical protein FRB99_004664, partial [Tulasnella sp. 403]
MQGGRICWDSDRSEVKMAKEAIASFQKTLEDTKRFLQLYMEGNWRSRFIYINLVEDHIKDVNSVQVHFQRAMDTTTINVDTIRKFRFTLLQIPDAERLEESDIRGLTHSHLRGYSYDFWKGVTAAQIGGQVRVLQAYNPTSYGMRKFLHEFKRMADDASNFLPCIYGYSMFTAVPFIVLSSNTVTGLFEYLVAQIRLDKDFALLNVWSTDAATFLYNNNPALDTEFAIQCAVEVGTIRRRILSVVNIKSSQDAVVDENGQVLITAHPHLQSRIQPNRPPNPSVEAVQSWFHELAKW